MKIVIDIDDEDYKRIQDIPDVFNSLTSRTYSTIRNGTPLTPDMLADLLMEERIRGKLKQDISYSKNIIDDVRCKLTVGIIDHRPCYCGAELREVWRESEDKE